MRIGIVNDSLLAIEALRQALATCPEYRVAWVAHDGAEAVDQCARDRPDLVLMDLFMPVMDGVEATRQIMARTPCPILIVTVSVGISAGRVFEAMGYGALDAVDTPVLSGASAQDSVAGLIAKIRRVGQLVKLRPLAPMPSATPSERWEPNGGQRAPLLAIGASAGGPAALAVLLRAMPADLQAAIVIVQHVDEQFAPGLANWLAQHCALPVRLAQDHDRLVAGTVLVAGRSDHLVLRRSGAVGYTREPIDYPYRPSVDVFLDSAARHWADRTVGVLLTGMGRDGAQGLKSLRDQGCYTVAQDASTCAVYGMPKAAAQLDAAVDILPLPRIAPRVLSALAALSTT